MKLSESTLKTTTCLTTFKKCYKQLQICLNPLTIELPIILS